MPEVNFEWVITDIDNWLDGNEFIDGTTWNNIKKEYSK
jgi:hypothetical protein